ncbi:hypothetical protein MN116_005407 [Schistosoma mekongi]|uniref:Transmembrane protein n=1 Tax=Schistosoma mekongi TaxID=38744 RepID=A0AAE2D5L4_SCHME|nr:hypothetical protein MN116_005407 [Schistosoma mekongi]
MFNSQWTLSNSSLLLLSIVLSLSYALLLLLLILSLLVGIFCHFTNSCYVFENYLQLSYSIVSPSSLTSSPTLLSFSSWILFVIFCSIWKLLYQVYKILLCYQKDILIFLANSISSSIGNFKAILLTQCIGSFNYLQNYTTKCNFNTKVTCIIAASTRRIHYKSLCHGMNRLFSLYLGILIFTELYGFTYVEGKPITGANERRFGHLDLHPSSSKSVHSSPQRTPKVVMPPYDLGFKGQKTDEVNKLRSSSLSSSSSSSSSFYKDNYGNFDQMNGFQSDETYDQGSQQRQHYQRVNRDEFEPQKN